MSTNRQLEYININLLHPHPNNPRENLGDLSELAESIKAKGVMQNLTVVPADDGYTVIIGHRRLAASKIAGLAELPCIITEMTPAEQEATMLLENVQRSDLNAYEQARGFQRLIHFGETIESISQKTGFSQTTVRRRVKMGELDQNKLKKISESRQISLAEIDELGKIENISVRNALLNSVGTDNFQWEVNKCYRTQEAAKKLPAAMEKIKKLKARKLKYNEKYNAKYSIASDEIDLLKWDGKKDFEIDKEGKLFYYLDENRGELCFYVEQKREVTKREKSKKEKEREERLAEIWHTADTLQINAKASRERFVTELKPTNKNIAVLLEAAVNALAMDIVGSYHDRNVIKNVLGLPDNVYISTRVYFENVKSIDLNDFPKIIFSSTEDNNEGYTQYYPNKAVELPVYTKNERLDLVYGYLKACGYRMSDEEIAYSNGTHDIFNQKIE